MPRPSSAHSPSRSARPAVTRNRRGLSTREAIVEAAHRLLEQKGFQSLSLDAVARAAGVTRSSVYHQFHSRDGLFLNLIAESLRRLQRDVRVTRRGSALERFLGEAEAGFRGDPELFRMFYLLVFDGRWGPPEVRALVREAYRFRTERLAANLRRDGGRPRREADDLAVLLVAALDGLYARRLVDLEKPRLRAVLGRLARLVDGRARADGGRRGTGHH